MKILKYLMRCGSIGLLGISILALLPIHAAGASWVWDKASRLLRGPKQEVGALVPEVLVSEIKDLKRSINQALLERGVKEGYNPEEPLPQDIPSLMSEKERLRTEWESISPIARLHSGPITLDSSYMQYDMPQESTTTTSSVPTGVAPQDSAHSQLDKYLEENFYDIDLNELETTWLFENIKQPTPEAILDLITSVETGNALPKGPSVQAMIIPRNSQVFVFGDIHSSFDQMLSQIQRMRKMDCFADPKSLKLKDEIYVVFTGDYIDRGNQGIEVMMLAMGLKKLNPQNVFLCRGNHEDIRIFTQYDFITEITRRFPTAVPNNIINHFEALFRRLPLAVFLGIKTQDGLVHFGMYNHAGLDNNSNVVQTIRHLLQKTVSAEEKALQSEPLSLDPIDSNLLWGDYHSYFLGRGQEYKEELSSDRTPTATSINLNKAQQILASYEGSNYTIDFVARGHQHMHGGILQLLRLGVYDENAGKNIFLINRQHFDKLTTYHDISRKYKPIFTFMVSSFNNYIDTSGIGCFTFNEARALWTLTPYIMGTKEHEVYAHQIKSYFGL